jgi:hypothetical protein
LATSLSLPPAWTGTGDKCSRVDLEKEIATGTWHSNPITTFC